ncbi:spore germination protein [Halalkalibacter hemicellulosilyticus]|uniref:Spore germination protein GerKA n=1 Tax=Halalkalibacter hemicellulosilyticusJCM 9152 TaxID=1236971 RepID=W4QDZ7_9BACI|nr:spore germination protein [Halalkalibacter hemicellulosilyticus]GAE30177.1 spore germination protein GerKA [Halalkalibacter hemicellulosilyticusJCM 9152]
MFGKKRKWKTVNYSSFNGKGDKPNRPVHPTLSKNIKDIQSVIGDDHDYNEREIKILDNRKVVVLYFGSLVNKDSINETILKPMIYIRSQSKDVEWRDKELKRFLFEEVIYHTEGQIVTHIDDILHGVLRGKCAVIVDGFSEAILFETKEVDKRGIEQPQGEQVIRGPRDGFIEHLQTNISLLRNRLPIEEFRVKPLEIGEVTKSTVVICYIDHIANEKLVEEVEKRLQHIHIDRILDTGYIEQLIEDNPRSPFPQIQYTERPDKAVGNLVEGRVVIMIEGTPLTLICPATFNQFFQTSEDYNERALMSSLVRIIRLMALGSSLLFPSLYVAVLSFHPELIPAEFAVAVTSGRGGIPFPVVVEVLLMEIAMEILREATVRMPQQVGGAISIVGVLVIGQAAVEAGFASPVTVVIIALSTIGSFATPAYNVAIAFRMLRFPILLLSGMFGLFGLVSALLLIFNHMLSLRSFGVPYLSPFSPVDWQSLRDSFIRMPLRWLSKRPEELHSYNTIRLDPRGKREPEEPLLPKEGNRNGKS